MTRDKDDRTGRAAPREALDAAAYVDGAMDDAPLEKEAFERRLAADPDLQERVAAYRRQDERLREALGPLLHVPVPEALYRPMQGRAERRRGVAVRSIAAAAAMVAVGAGGGWSAATYLQGGSAAPVHAVLDVLRHEDMLAAILTAPDGGGAAPLSAGMAGAVPAAQLEASGLTEIERSMKTVAGQPALIVDYRTRLGEAVTLMVQRRAAPSVNHPATLVQKDGLSASIWTGGTTVYTLISPTNGGADIGALTARIRGGYPPQGSIPIPTPLMPNPEQPLARDMPNDRMAIGPGDIQLKPGIGQMPGEAIPNVPSQAPQGTPEGQSL